MNRPYGYRQHSVEMNELFFLSLGQRLTIVVSQRIWWAVLDCGWASNVEVNQDSCQGSIVWGFFSKARPPKNPIGSTTAFSGEEWVERGGETAGMCIIHGIAGQNKPSQVVA